MHMMQQITKSVLVVIFALEYVAAFNNEDVTIAEKGSDVFLYFHFPDIVTATDMYLGKIAYNSPFDIFSVLENHVVPFSTRVSMTCDGKKWLTIKINRVDKTDEGPYLIIRKNGWNTIGKTVLLVTDNSSLQYDETLLLEEPNSSLNISVKRFNSLTNWYLMRFNGTFWTGSVNDDRCIFQSNGENLTIDSRCLTNNEEGIYSIVYEDDKKFVRLRTIRVLIKEIRFSSQTNTTVTTGTEGETLSLDCEIQGSYHVNHLYIVTKDKIVATSDPPFISYNILLSRNDHLSSYECKAEILDYPSMVMTETQLLIYYPPAVRVLPSIDDKILQCIADGNPTHYTFFWVHQLTPYSSIQALEGLSNGTLLLKENLQNLAENGIFSCLASNGIHDTYEKLYQTGNYPESFPEESKAGVVVSSVLATILFVYIILSHVVYFLRHRKPKDRRHSSNDVTDYDEIGTIHYQPIPVSSPEYHEPAAVFPTLPIYQEPGSAGSTSNRIIEIKTSDEEEHSEKDRISTDHAGYLKPEHTGSDVMYDYENPYTPVLTANPNEHHYL